MRMRPCSMLCWLDVWAVMLAVPTAALGDQYPDIPSLMQMSAGFSLVHLDEEPMASYGSDGPGALYAGSLNAIRSGTRQEVEHDPDEGSLLLGVRLETFPLPQRFYLDTEVDGDEHWFGELRYSYADTYQFRGLSRRFVHNLDNRAIFDLDPDPELTAVSRLDLGKEYQLTIDIDQFRLRLKTPDFPFHLYTIGEMIHLDGERQQLFRGNLASGHSQRVSKAMPVDQQTTSVTVGADSHLRWIEADLSHTWQQFDSDVADRYYYPASGVRATGYYGHNLLPDLRTSKNSLRVHTTQTGQVVASATLLDINRINQSGARSDIEAQRRLGYTDILWTPLANVSLGTKYRRQTSTGSGPGTIPSPWNGAALTIVPGVASVTEAYTAFVRYSPVRSVMLKGQYSIEHKKRDQDSALDWHLAEEEDTDLWEAGATWRPCHKGRLRVNYRLRDSRVDSGAASAIFNNVPERTQDVTAEASFSPTAKTTLLMSLLLEQDTADTLSALFGPQFVPVLSASGREAKNDDSVRQRYLASVTHAFANDLSVTGTYVFSKSDAERDFSAFAGGGIVDAGYHNTQAYHSVILSALLQMWQRFTFEPSFDYTIATGDYALTDSYLNQYLPLGDIAMADVKEAGVRLDGTYDFGQGWKAGVVVRYATVIDKSFDNPAEGEMMGLLLKMIKVFP